MRPTSQIIRLLEEVEKEQKELDAKQARLSERRERLLKELSESMDKEKYTFNDDSRSVKWTSGNLVFRSDGWRMYCILKLLHNAHGESLTFAEIAEITYGNPLSDIHNTIYRLRNKLEENDYPKNLVICKQTAILV